MLNTPLHAWHVAHGGRMVDFAGWSMPVQYTTIVEEHQTVRSNVGLFDISHMGRLAISGPEAVSLVERLVTCRVANMKIGQIRYGLVTNESGGILDDILIYRITEDRLQLVVNASNREKICTWIESQTGRLRAAMQDATLDTAMIAVQGPAAVKILNDAVESLRYYRCGKGELFGVPAQVSRTGYTGEDGFEFIVDAAAAETVWRALLAEQSSAVSVIPCGLGCRDTLRLEAAMPLYGHELNEDIDPITAGLSFAVDLDKDFIGCNAIAKIAEQGPTRVRVGLKLNGKRIAREGTPVLADGQVVGEVTSGTFSPTLQSSIAMAYVPPGLAQVGTSVSVDLRGKTEAATVVELPFYKRAPKS